MSSSVISRCYPKEPSVVQYTLITLARFFLQTFLHRLLLICSQHLGFILLRARRRFTFHSSFAVYLLTIPTILDDPSTHRESDDLTEPSTMSRNYHVEFQPVSRGWLQSLVTVHRRPHCFFSPYKIHLIDSSADETHLRMMNVTFYSDTKDFCNNASQETRISTFFF